MSSRSFLTSFIGSTVYVRVKKDEFHVRHLESGAEATVKANTPFTTSRQLIGTFTTAESILRRAIKQVSKSGFLSPAPLVVIQPLEMIEGGLSQVRYRPAGATVAK